MLPDRATMYIAGAGPGALDLEFWRDVYSFSYRCLQMLHNVPGRAWPIQAGQALPCAALMSHIICCNVYA